MDSKEEIFRETIKKMGFKVKIIKYYNYSSTFGYLVGVYGEKGKKISFNLEGYGGIARFVLKGDTLECEKSTKILIEYCQEIASSNGFNQVYIQNMENVHLKNFGYLKINDDWWTELNPEKSTYYDLLKITIETFESIKEKNPLFTYNTKVHYPTKQCEVSYSNLVTNSSFVFKVKSNQKTISMKERVNLIDVHLDELSVRINEFISRKEKSDRLNSIYHFPYYKLQQFCQKRHIYPEKYIKLIAEELRKKFKNEDIEKHSHENLNSLDGHIYYSNGSNQVHLFEFIDQIVIFEDKNLKAYLFDRSKMEEAKEIYQNYVFETALGKNKLNRFLAMKG
jgi:hypothetical protein